MTTSAIKSARFFKLWMDHPDLAVAQLVKEIQTQNIFKPDIRTYESGSVIMKEFDKNDVIFVVLSGEVDLMKLVHQEGHVKVTSVSHGNMFGLMSFFSRDLALTTAIAATRCEVLRLRRRDVEKLTASSHGIAVMSRQLLISNLMERYRQVVELNVELHILNAQIELERRRLDEALSQLKNAHERLIHQEKMATLGQLVAGVAHEINNPVSALDSAIGYLRELLPFIFTSSTSLDGNKMGLFFKDGLTNASTSLPSREDLDALHNEFELLKSADYRRIFILGKETRDFIAYLYESKRFHELTSYLKLAEAGAHVRRVTVTSQRISGLVKSLKQYSRQEATGDTKTKVKEGISDTLMILGNRLKHTEVIIEIPDDLPDVYGDPGEWNQVWTNIIVNASDAIGSQGIIRIRAVHINYEVMVTIEDNGPGIPDALREKIFQPHFTTRNSSGNFGLGLGLFITRELVGKNHGTIALQTCELGGACFQIKLKINK